MENKLSDRLISCMPDRLIREIDKFCGADFEDITEIRIRVSQPASLTVLGNNIPLEFRITSFEMNEFVSKLCNGSVYAHGSGINDGYIEFSDGIRIGVCGKCIDGKVSSIYSLNIRIPHFVRWVSDPIIKRYCLEKRISSMLIYSLPGVGKTTLLRDMASKLSCEHHRRVALIDTRSELYIPELFKDSLCDVFSGYPRAKAIEIATRTLSPEVLICDEIGGTSEAESILAAQNTGVPLIASAHASNLHELLLRPGIKLLHDFGIFSYYIGISREKVGERLPCGFVFEETSSEEAMRV